MTTPDPYIKNDTELLRLRSMERHYDPGTLQIVTRLQVGGGWRCLEAGAGAGSVALSLSTLGALVVAVDIDARFLKPFASDTLEVVEADISSTSFDEEFDLVHARFLLDLVLDSDKVLDGFASALRPGGWLVLEEFDDVTASTASAPDPGSVSRHSKALEAKQAVWAQRGLPNDLGRALPGYLAGRGLVDVHAEGRLFVRQGGTAGVEPWRYSIVQLRDEMVATGCITADELSAYLADLDDPSVFYLSPLTIAVWARKPGRV